MVHARRARSVCRPCRRCWSRAGDHAPSSSVLAQNVVLARMDVERAPATADEGDVWSAVSSDHVLQGPGTTAVIRIRGRDSTVTLVRMVLASVAVLIGAALLLAQRETKRVDDTFYPAWAATAKYNRDLLVRDTDSALGRLNLQAKRLTLRDAAVVHGHLCDGLVISWIELGAALRALFPDGTVDRTDVRVVSKNGPCWSDVAAWTTGARINHRTLVLDDAMGAGFIVQRISAGATVRALLKQGAFPAALAELEASIRAYRARDEAVEPEGIRRFEAEADEFSCQLLNAAPESVVQIERLEGFTFPTFSPNPFAARSDVINRDVARVAQNSLPPRKRVRTPCVPTSEK